jgi:hypothetical protein
MTDRRAGRVPHVPSSGGGKQPRARNQNAQWRAKRSDAGKKRGRKSRGLFSRLFG